MGLLPLQFCRTDPDAAGSLYGTTTDGGIFLGPWVGLGCGVVFKLGPQARRHVDGKRAPQLYRVRTEPVPIFPAASSWTRRAISTVRPSTGCLRDGVGVRVEARVRAAGMKMVLHYFIGVGLNPVLAVLDRAGNSSRHHLGPVTTASTTVASLRSRAKSGRRNVVNRPILRKSRPCILSVVLR